MLIATCCHFFPPRFCVLFSCLLLFTNVDLLLENRDDYWTEERNKKTLFVFLKYYMRADF